MGKNSCGCTARSLSTEVELRFGMVLLLACILAGVLTTVLERSAVDLTVTLMGDATKSSEIASIGVRVQGLAKTASSLFMQAAADAEYQAENAKNILDGNKAPGAYGTGSNPTTPYISYDYTGSNPPASVQSGTADKWGLTYYDNFYTSGWYNRGNPNLGSEDFMPVANYLDNAFIPLYMGNPNYAEIYMGFENDGVDGMMKKFPWYSAFDGTSFDSTGECLRRKDGSSSDSPYTDGYACMKYDCVTGFNNATGLPEYTDNNNQVTNVNPGTEAEFRYTPTCRGWYQKAKAFKDAPGAIFSNPYRGASKGRAMITVAKAVVTATDSFIGAIGIDIYIQTLADSVLNAKILNDGYTYMIDANMNLVMHKDIPDMSKMYTVSEVEFGSTPDTGFIDALSDSIANLGSVTKIDFVKDGQDWYGIWEPITGTDYTMVMVVPYADINASADAILIDGEVALSHLIGWVIGIGIMSFILSLMAARYISAKISNPVESFNQVIQDINDKNFDDEDNETMDETEFSQINRLQSKILSLYLAVKFSTNAYYKSNFRDALKYLDEVEKLFADMHQMHALGVVHNNKGEILRAGVKEITGTDTPRRVAALYEESLKSFRLSVANARFLLRSAEEKLDEDTDDMAEKRAAAAERIAYAKRLGDRLSNMAICFKSAKRYEEALETLEESSQVLSSADDVNGIVRVMGNRGLVFMDLANFREADRIFQEAYQVSFNAFQTDPNETTVQAFQLSCVNVGQHLKTMIEENLIPPEKKQQAINDALKHLYFALTVSNRIKKDILARSVRNVAEIYKKFFSDEVGEEAFDKLEQMFPNVLKASGLNHKKPKISVLVDVSPSMNANKRIYSATETLQNIIDTKLTSSDYISLDCFASRHDQVVQMTKLTPEARSIVNDAVYALNFRCTAGVTHFYKALKEVGENIIMSKKNSEQALVFALTDGEDNEYNTRQSTVRKLFKENNITLMIITIGIQKNGSTYRKLLELVESQEFLIAANGDDRSAIDEAMKTGFDFVQQHGSVVMETL